MDITSLWNAHYRSFRIGLLLLVAFNSKACINSTHGLIIITEYGANESREKTVQALSTESNNPAGLGAISKMFLTALYQEAAPILVPAPLMHIIKDHTDIAHTLLHNSADYFFQTYCLHTHFRDAHQTRHLHASTSYLNRLYKAVDVQAHGTLSAADHEKALWNNLLFDASAAPHAYDEKSNTWHEAISYLICYYAPWQNYEVRLITQGSYCFYLCIPKKLLAYSIPERFSLKRGLRYEAYPLVYDPLQNLCTGSLISDPVMVQSGYDEALYNVLHQLLIPKTGAHSEVLWTFYCMGHGSFSYDAQDKIQEQMNAREQWLQNKTRYEREANQWNNQTVQWQEKQHIVRTYDARLNAYITYDQDAVQHNIHACQHNASVCQWNQNVCDQNLAGIQHNITSLSCANMIAGISQGWFRKILQLFDTQVKTNMLFYRSCCAGGQQLVDVFTDENNQPLKLSYAVIVGTLCEAASSTVSPIFHLSWFKDRSKNLLIRIPIEKLVDTQNHTVMLDSRYNLARFFSQTQLVDRSSFDMQSWIETINPVMRCVGSNTASYENCAWFDSDMNEREDIANIPSIRFPYETIFHVIDLHATIDPLTSKKLTYDGVSEYSIHAPYEVVLIYAPVINKMVRVPMREHGLFPAFVSMIPGPSYQMIEKIDASSYALSTILKSFFTCTSLQVPKLFYVRSISGINDMLPWTQKGQVQTITNVHIFNYGSFNQTTTEKKVNHVNGIMFECQGQTYYVSWPSNDQVPANFVVQTISGSQQKNMIDALTQQCCTKKQSQYVEPDAPVLTVHEVEQKLKTS